MGLESKVRYLTRLLKSHDSNLYAQETRLGRIDIYRKSSLGCNPPHFLFALTENWTVDARSVDWGIEPVLHRIKELDLWNNESLVDDLIKGYEKTEKAKEREFSNMTESFLHDYRKPFARATDGVNTSLLQKTDRRREHEKLRGF